MSISSTALAITICGWLKSRPAVERSIKKHVSLLCGSKRQLLDKAYRERLPVRLVTFTGASILLYPCYKVHIPLISIFDTYGLPYHHRNDGLCLSHAAVNGGAACGMSKREHAHSPSAYKSADGEQASSPVCLPGSPSVSYLQAVSVIAHLYSALLPLF